MLRIEKLSFSYSKNKILKDINCEIKSKMVCGILGSNGSGKTTLLKIMAGLLRPDSGKVFINNRDLSDMSILERAFVISYIPQKISYFPDTIVYDAIILGRKPYIKFTVSNEDKKKVNDVINILGLEKLKTKNINRISGGEFQKTLIAQALVKEPKVMLFDEPLNNLDISNQIKTMKLIRDITHNFNIATAIVIHDINMALRYCDYFIMMKDGKIEYCGEVNIINSNSLKNIFGVELYTENINGKTAVFF